MPATTPRVAVPSGTARRVLIFDTSGINRLADDSDSSWLVAGLSAAFTCRLAGTSVDEIAATASRSRRHQLLCLCRRLLSTGDCMQPHQVLLETLLAHHSKSKFFNWKTIDVSFPDYENEIARQEIVDDKLASEQREHLVSSQSEFAKVFDDARPHFDKLFQGGNETRPGSFQELVAALQVEGGAFWSFGTGLYEATTKTGPDEQTIHKVIDDCPPFRALLLALCVAQYDRCIKCPNTGPSLRAGRYDLFMSVFLPYCDKFITGDERQRRCLVEVSSVGKLNVEVCSYDDWRASFSIFGGPLGLQRPDTKALAATDRGVVDRDEGREVPSTKK